MYSNNLENPINLILVEDDKLYREYLREIILENPRFIITAETDNGESAISLSKELNPDVVLMDVGLPKMDGIDATREIKKVNQDIKVIILTAHSEEQEAMESLSAGANAYARKTVKGSELVMIIQTIYKGAVWIDPLIGYKVLLKFLGK